MPCTNPRWQALWNQNLEIIRYELQFQTAYFVGDGISKGASWFTLTRKPNGSQSRVVSKWLPERDTREEAERDLYAWLRNTKGLK